MPLIIFSLVKNWYKYHDKSDWIIGPGTRNSWFLGQKFYSTSKMEIDIHPITQNSPFWRTLQ